VATTSNFDTRTILIASLANVTPAMTVSTMGVVLPEIRATLGLTEMQGGALFSAMFVVAAVASPAAGRLSDRMGKKTVLIVGMGFLSVAFMLAGLSRLYPLTLVLLGLAGAGYGFTTPSTYALMSELLPGRRGLATGLVSVSYALGGLVGPIVASHVGAAAGWSASFLTTGAIGVTLTALQQLGVRVPSGQRGSHPPQPYRKAVNRNLVLLALAELLAGSVFWSTISWAPTVLRAAKSLSLTEAGFVMAAWETARVFGALLLGVASDKLGRKAMILWTAYPGALAAFVVFYFLNSPVSLACGVTIFGLLISSFPALVVALAQDSVEPGALGRASGLIMSTHYVSAVLAPLVTAKLMAGSGNMIWSMVAVTSIPLIVYASLVALARDPRDRSARDTSS
jgi:MFS family permease